MARYDWPREFTKSADRLVHRQEQALQRDGSGLPDGLSGNLDDLDDVISHNFEEARTWVPIGPSILTNGQAGGNPVVAGRVRDVRVSDNGQRIYVASANGGVWYSSDTGASWTPLGAASLAPGADRSDLSLTIGALLVEFGKNAGVDDPSRDIVYVGTGEAKPRVSSTPGGRSGGVGILRLKDPLTVALAAPLQNPWVREARNLTGAGIFRLARNPAVTPGAAGNGTFVAATSTGLYSRTGAFGEDSNWSSVEFAPDTFADYDGAYCSDVVWNDKGLWVTLIGAGNDDGLYLSTGGLGGTFNAIDLPGYEKGTRLSLGEAGHATDRMYVLGKVPSPTAPDVNTGHANLWQVDLATSTTVARNVPGVPVGLFVSEVKNTGGNLIISGADQADYDQAIAVRIDSGKDFVTLGGSLESNVGWEAALFDLEIDMSSGAPTADFLAAHQTSPPSSPTFVGSGIHPDVHFITHSGTAMWVGCDGGLFRRQGGSARSMNAGLAVAEPGYVVSHPTLDGVVLAGTQDNGAIQRIGDTVWTLQRKGDGGGCLFHPTKPHLRLIQYTSAGWNFEPPGYTPPSAVLRTASPYTDGEKRENRIASFYSQGAVARGVDDDNARLFLGTYRIWYSQDWNSPGTAMNWVTIPSMADPYGGNAEQDRLVEGSSYDNVHVIEVLHEGDASANFVGAALLVLCKFTVRIFRLQDNSGSLAWTPIASSVVSVAGSGERPKAKKRGDEVATPFLDNLPLKTGGVWTDIAVHTNTAGRETFYVSTTGVVSANDAGVLVADENFDTLWWYNGQGRWYPTGLRNTPLDPADGTGGSPTAAHSVVVDPDDANIVYVGNRVGVWRGEIDQSAAHPAWTWKPAMEGLPLTLVQDLSISKTDAGKFLRAALVSRGVWERDISDAPTSVGRTYIRSLPHDTGRAQLAEVPRDPVTDTVTPLYQSPDIVVPDNVAQAWEPGLPNEADMLAVAPLASYAKAVYPTYVMVHHRHTTPATGGTVNVDVFLQKAAPAGPLESFAITAPWRTAIRETVRQNGPAMPAGLVHIGRFHPADPVDGRTPRAVRVPVDLNYAGANDHAYIIAVVTSPDNDLTAADIAAANLRDIVRATGRVAVRRLKRT